MRFPLTVPIARKGPSLAHRRKDKGSLEILTQPDMIIVKFANSIYPDEVAHDEPLHMDLYYLASSV